MLRELQWDSLEERRKRNRLTLLYKIHNGQTGIDATKYLTPLRYKSGHVNAEPFKVQFTHTEYFKFSFFPRTIREWNILPQNVVKAPSHAAFVALVSVL